MTYGMPRRSKRRLFYGITTFFLAFCIAFSEPLVALADEKEDRIASHRAMQIQSNEVSGWPTGPVVSAESAILMEAETRTILYAKNIHKKQYPASTTKILTALLAYENSSLDEIVTFSHDDIFSIPKGSNNISMNVGYELSMEDCLNALLIRSANEVAYAIAAHVGGSWDAFAEMMNLRARELGAVDSNFVNPNGLPNEDHVTSAYDLAMIGRAFFSNDYLCNVTLQKKLEVTKPNGTLIDWNQMALIPSGKYAYEYLVGCKTGYTDSARSTLVSCAEKNGMRLICVVLNDENPQHNEDTIALFEYGFQNFKKVNVSQVETKYDIDNIGFFYSSDGIFGESTPLLSLNQNACIIQPNSVPFQDLDSTIYYDIGIPGHAAVITYSYHGVPLGSVTLDINDHAMTTYAFDSQETAPPAETTSPSDGTKPGENQEEKKSSKTETDKKDPENKDTGKKETNKKEVKEKTTPRAISINPKLLIYLGCAVCVIALIALVIWFLRKNYSFNVSWEGLKRFLPRKKTRRPRPRRDRSELRLSSEMKKKRDAEIRRAKKRYRDRMRRQ